MTDHNWKCGCALHTDGAIPHDSLLEPVGSPPMVETIEQAEEWIQVLWKWSCRDMQYINELQTRIDLLESRPKLHFPIRW